MALTHFCLKLLAPFRSPSAPYACVSAPGSPDRVRFHPGVRIAEPGPAASLRRQAGGSAAP